jgi:anti-anti-sigma factor
VRDLLRNLVRPRASVVPSTTDVWDDAKAPAFAMREFPLGPGRVQLSVTGVIDLHCRDELRNRLIAMIAIDHVDDLVVDLDRVEFLDCSGIGALVDGRNAADAAGRRFQLQNPRGMVATILQLTGTFAAADVANASLGETSRSTTNPSHGPSRPAKVDRKATETVARRHRRRSRKMAEQLMRTDERWRPMD